MCAEPHAIFKVMIGVGCSPDIMTPPVFCSIIKTTTGGPDLSDPGSIPVHPIYNKDKHKNDYIKRKASLLLRCYISKKKAFTSVECTL